MFTLSRKSFVLSPYCTYLVNKIANGSIYYEKIESLDTDAIDDFTNQLVQAKANKWITFYNKRVNEQDHILLKSKKELNFETFKIEDIDKLIKNACDIGDEETIKRLIDQSRQHQKLPSLSVILQALTLFAQKGDVDTINVIRDTCQVIDPCILEENAGFNQFLAEAIWIKGNIIEAISLIENVYQNHIYLRRRIRLMLKYLIHDGVCKGSEAVLHSLIKFCERIAKEYCDYYPMVLVWENCILSDWFSDQCIALDLLKKHKGLRRAVTDLLSFVVMSSLHKSQSDNVYRLLELFLQENQKIQSHRILITLFDFKIRKGDLRGCSEIIKWAEESNITLPSIQHEKFIHLLLKNSIKQQKIESNSVLESINFKF